MPNLSVLRPDDPHSRDSHFLVEILRSEGDADLAATTLAAISPDALTLTNLVAGTQVALTQVVNQVG